MSENSKMPTDNIKTTIHHPSTPYYPYNYYMPPLFDSHFKKN